MLKPENKNHTEMRPCIIAAADTVQGIVDQQKKTNISESAAPFH